MPAMDKATQDVTLGTFGWFSFGAAPVGMTAGQTARLTVANLSSSNAVVLCGVWQNPRPLSLNQDSYTLGPGEARNCDLNASDLAKEIFDKAGRAQIRGFVRSSSRAVCANLEVFDSKTGRTSFVLPLQGMPDRE
jgi:hypothetical protein